MNKVVIDFPPGACGHFIARVLNGEYNFVSGKLGEFHNLHHSYTSITTTEEYFPKIFESTQSNENVICLHNFKNYKLDKVYPTHALVSIYIDSTFDDFLQNFYYKAISSNKEILTQYHRDVNNKFKNSPCPLREEFFNLYSWLSVSSWKDKKENHINLPFSYIYSYQLLEEFLSEHNFILPDNFKEIHKDFLYAQNNILTKSKIFAKIVEAVSDKKIINIPLDLTEVDRGILSAMLYKSTGVDVININSSNWFKNTKEILEYQ